MGNTMEEWEIKASDILSIFSLLYSSFLILILKSRLRVI